ncbi:MAG: peptidoglycan editing factor PgeF, partial [Vicinamibacterales bacterium]
FTWTQEPWGSALRCTHLPAPHLVTSRDLTLRYDEREWRGAAGSLGVARERLLLVKQVHGAGVIIARRGAAAGWGRPEADAIITDDPDVAIGVLVADCAPVLIYDPVRHVAAAIHAGWRGTAANASGSAVAALVRELGSNPADLVAAIGPCLGACCGEVGPDVVEAFGAGGADQTALAAWFTAGTGDRSFLDLERANRDQLTAAGLDPARVFTSSLCTKTHVARLHSYRADRTAAGRLLGAIRLNKPV